MNKLQIVNRLRQEAGIATSDLTTTSGQSGESKRCVDWCNSAWMDLQTMRQDWFWMRSTAAFQTVAGQSTYTPAQCGVSNFGKWTRETFRNYTNPVVSLTVGVPCVITLQANRFAAGDTVTFATTGALPTGLTAGTTYYVVSPTADTFEVATTAGGTPITTTGTQSGTHTISSNNTDAYCGLRTEVFMSYLDYEDWRNAYQYGALRSVETRPMVISITPARSLALGPTPDAGYTVLGDYYRAPAELATDAESPSLPERFHMAIVYRALLHYGMFESAGEVIQRSVSESEKWSRRILLDQTQELSQSGALT